jgi:hypothetical protein
LGGSDGTEVSVTEGFSLEIAAAPQAALARIAGGINHRSKRLLGVLKVENEYVGHAWEGRFEIWERRQRAVHAVGTVRPVRGGSRIDARFVVPPQTRVLIAIFFVLYAAIALGLAFRTPGDALTIEELLFAGVGATILGALFMASARRQRRDLRNFLERLFADAPRV